MNKPPIAGSTTEIHPPRAKRNRVLLQGRIVIGPELHPCVIRDLSRAGVKISLPVRIALPERFELVIAADDLRMVGVCLRWRRGEFAGLTFDPPIPPP